MGKHVNCSQFIEHWIHRLISKDYTLDDHQGGRGLIGAEECVMLEINSPGNYISRTGEIALRAVYQEQILNDIGKDKKAVK